MAEEPSIESFPHRRVDVPATGIVVLQDVRGAAVGNHVTQVNLYVFRVTAPGIDLGKRLDDEDVRGLVQALARDPDDEQARTDLVDALTAQPLWGAADCVLTIASVRGTGGSVASILDGTVLVQNCEGVVVGDHARIDSEFVYAVTPSGRARDLLAGNPPLAKALVDVAFPAKHGATGSLERAFADAVATLDVDDGVARGVHVPAPRPGTKVHIRSADGVLVGDGSDQRIRQRVDQGGVKPRVRRRARPASVGDGRHFGVDPPQSPSGQVPGESKTVRRPTVHSKPEPPGSCSPAAGPSL